MALLIAKAERKKKRKKVKEKRPILARMSHRTQTTADDKLNLLQFRLTLVLLYCVPFLCIARCGSVQREQRNQDSDVSDIIRSGHQSPLIVPGVNNSL